MKVRVLHKIQLKEDTPQESGAAFPGDEIEISDDDAQIYLQRGAVEPIGKVRMVVEDDG